MVLMFAEDALGGGSDPNKASERAAAWQLYGIKQARKEKDLTAGKVDTEVSKFASAAEALFSPYTAGMEQGMDTLDMLSNPDRFQEVLDSFYANPQYKVLMEEGNRAIERKMAASGDRYSGAQVAGMIEHSQQQANKYLGEYTDRQLGIAAKQIGVGEFGVRGVHDAKRAGYEGKLDVLSALDRSQDEIEKANIRAGLEIEKGERRDAKKQGIAGALGATAGGILGFAMGGPLGAMMGANMGQGLGAGAA